MKKLKFRVWTGIGMEYDVVAGNLGNFYAKIDPNDTACLNPTSKYHETTPIMQFTGRHDRNGKEIYEDDIVERVYDKRRYRVIYNLSDLAYTCVYQGGDELLCDYDFNVIGNYYENPELLVNK